MRALAKSINISPPTPPHACPSCEHSRSGAQITASCMVNICWYVNICYHLVMSCLCGIAAKWRTGTCGFNLEMRLQKLVLWDSIAWQDLIQLDVHSIQHPGGIPRHTSSLPVFCVAPGVWWLRCFQLWNYKLSTVKLLFETLFAECDIKKWWKPSFRFIKKVCKGWQEQCSSRKQTQYECNRSACGICGGFDTPTLELWR